jgi:hypothetical protein
MQREESGYPLKHTKLNERSWDSLKKERKEVSRKGAKAQRRQAVFLCAFAPLRETSFVRCYLPEFQTDPLPNLLLLMTLDV